MSILRLFIESSLFVTFFVYLMCSNPFLDPNIPSHNPYELTITSATAESWKFFVNCQISNAFHYAPHYFLKIEFYLPLYKVEF